MSASTLLTRLALPYALDSHPCRPSQKAKELILYLDYDGILHPADVIFSQQGPVLAEAVSGHSLFENADMLAAVLAEYPEVRLVLSTSWVFHYGLEYAASRLPPPLRKAVVGATFDPARHNSGFLSVARGHQVVEDAKRRKATQWVSLDDDSAAWPARQRHRLIQANPAKGLRDPQVLRDLRAALDKERDS